MKFISLLDDPWCRLDDEAAPGPGHRAVLMSLARWQRHEDWPSDTRKGVILANTDDVEALGADLPGLSLIALQFPKWVDGRAYSQARLLRSRLGYRGELRATGEVLVDMLPLLRRTGFDAVHLRADQSESHARRALTEISAHYQGDVVQTRPLFARLPA